MFAPAAVLLLLAPLLIQGAPQQGQESQRSESPGDSGPLTLVNPFGSADESRRFLQSYIKANWEEQANPDVNTWEQEVFFLFSLHDYDKSGQLDGLELMKLLSDFLSHHSQTPKSTDGVVAMVDFLLQTQDQNQDGLLAPSELLSPPIQGSNKPVEPDSAGPAGPDSQDQPKEEEASPQQVGEPALKEDGPSDTANEQEHPQGETEGEGKPQEQQPEEERVAQEEAKDPDEQDMDKAGDPEEEKQAQEQDPAQEQPEADTAQEQQQSEEQRLEPNAVENHQDHPPVHQGQPEM